MADQGFPNDYAAELQIGTRELELESLTALNKSATNYYLQLFNLNFSPSRAGITSGGDFPGQMFLAGHGFRDGDAVAYVVGGVTNNWFVRIAPPAISGSADRFYLYDTLAHALDRTSNAGMQNPSFPGTTQITGIIPEEMPLLGTGSVPSNIVSYLNGRFTRGLYVRAVTAINGTTLGGSDVKFTPRFRYTHGA